MGFEPKILGVSGVLLGEIGEAVAIDLGQRGVVFALMSDQSWENGLYQAFPTQDAYSRRGFEYYRKTLKTGMQAEWRENQPIFVTFNDLNDPLSVKSVRIGNLEQEFGEGIRFKRISVEITDEPVTRDIEKWLPWLPNRKKGSLDGQLGKFSNDLSNALHYGNFKKGFKQ